MLQNDLAHEKKVINTLVDSTRKVKVLKEQFKNATIELGKMNEELLLVKGQNFEINQSLVKIVENKDAPYADCTSQLIDAKVKPVLTKINEILDVTCSYDTAQQRKNEEVNEDEVPEVNLKNPYDSVKMPKTDNANKIVLEKKYLKDRLKNLKELKTDRKGNISSGSEKGKVNIVSEEDDDLNPKIFEKKLK